MDHAIKCWKLDTEAMQDAIEKSYTFDVARTQRSFNSLTENYPEYSTRDVHPHYIDCIRWFGSLIISKVRIPRKSVSTSALDSNTLFELMIFFLVE